MLYVVELDFTQPERQAEWDEWYIEHAHILLAMPGFHSAQRFRCLTPWRQPYLAVYNVDSPSVFETPQYRNRGGRGSTGDWQPLMINWDRNLFDGMVALPRVTEDQVVLQTEASAAEVAGCGASFVWLTAIGLDKTVPHRGIAIMESAQGKRIAEASGGRIRAYRRYSEQVVSPNG